MSSETISTPSAWETIISLLSATQKEELLAQDLQAIPFPAEKAVTSLSAAVARLLDIPVLSLDAVKGDLLDGAAKVYGVRLAVMDADGEMTVRGAEGKPLVRLAEVGEDDERRYLGLRQGSPVVVLSTPDPSKPSTPVIGLPGLAYPGPSLPPTKAKGPEKHPIYRGEFEVELDGGAYFVRLYCAIAGPVTVTPTVGKPGMGTSKFKDVNQTGPTGPITLSGGSDEGVLWVGGGRPQRAVQWMRKYQNNYPDLQPMLRTFLVPLKDYLTVTETLRPEGDGGGQSVNVDQHGEPNQIGLRGDQLEALAAVAKPGSLITYVSKKAGMQLEDVAGEVRLVADLYAGLGIDAFQSDVAGREYDPWFTWTWDEGRKAWKAKFQNNASFLHRIARELREHSVTWQQSLLPAKDRTPSALLDGDVEGWPGKRADTPPADMTYAARKIRLNVFLNKAGPPAAVVTEILTQVVGVGAAAAKEVLDAAKDQPLIDVTAVRKALADRVLPDAAAAAIDKVVETVKGEFPTATDAPAFVKVVDGDWTTKAGKKDGRKFVLTPAAAALAAAVDAHPLLAGLPEATRRALVNVIRDNGADAVKRQTRALAVTPPAGKWPSTRKDKWLAGLYKYAPAPLAKDTTLLQAIDGVLGMQAKTAVELGLVRDLIETRLVPEVRDACAEEFRKRDLVDAAPAAIKKTVADELVPDMERAFEKALSASPLLAFVAEDFRLPTAKKVAAAARRLGEAAAKSLNPAQVTTDQVKTFMAKIPAVASQAAIGALIAADYERLKVDPDVRTVDPADTGDLPPFSNSFAGWHATRAKQEERHREAGKRLTGLLVQDEATPQQIAYSMVEALLEDLPELTAKFDEICAPTEKLTFYDHAQLVLGQFLTLAGAENDSARFVSRDTIAKAILFHDIEKAHSKAAYGSEKAAHDREPEHLLAVAMMRRYAPLWSSYRGFLAARALVDSDPIGLYLREAHDADTAFAYIVESAYRLRVAREAVPVREETPSRTPWELDREAVERALSTAGRRPGPDLAAVKPDGVPADAQRFFAEFHQYYQADFSSYTPTASYQARGADSVAYAPNKQFAKAFKWAGGSVTDGGRLERDGGRFVYTTAYEERYTTLAAMFATPAKVIEHYARIREAERKRVTAELADPTT